MEQMKKKYFLVLKIKKYMCQFPIFFNAFSVIEFHKNNKQKLKMTFFKKN